VLVEYATLQRIGHADLFGSWSVAGASFAMGQIPRRLCSLPELFAFPSRQICASDLFPQPVCGSCRNSIIVFSSPMSKESLTNLCKQPLHWMFPKSVRANSIAASL